jgi:FkbM family methyltransferase
VRSGVVLPPGSRVDAQNSLHVPGLGIALSEPTDITFMLLKVLPLATSLHQRSGASFEIHSDCIDIRLPGINGVAFNSADISVFHEVFGELLYEFHIPGEFAIMDIGMNIGLATLFFAHRYRAKVAGFELVPSTFEVAKKNIELNPALAPLIEIYPFGVGDKDEELQITVAPSHRAGNSLYAHADLSDSRKEKVIVKDVVPILNQFMAENAGRKLVLKVDAEGAEYEIMDRLAGSGLLDSVEIILLEWHERDGKNPESIRTHLRKSGFHWFERQHGEAPVGLINAFRPSK